jgi:hypothetical protein
LRALNRMIGRRGGSRCRRRRRASRIIVSTIDARRHACARLRSPRAHRRRGSGSRVRDLHAAERIPGPSKRRRQPARSRLSKSLMTPSSGAGHLGPHAHGPRRYRAPFAVERGRDPPFQSSVRDFGAAQHILQRTMKSRRAGGVADDDPQRVLPPRVSVQRPLQSFNVVGRPTATCLALGRGCAGSAGPRTRVMNGSRCNRRLEQINARPNRPPSTGAAARARMALCNEHDRHDRCVPSEAQPACETACAQSRANRCPRRLGQIAHGRDAMRRNVTRRVRALT